MEMARGSPILRNKKALGFLQANLMVADCPAMSFVFVCWPPPHFPEKIYFLAKICKNYPGLTEKKIRFSESPPPFRAFQNSSNESFPYNNQSFHWSYLISQLCFKSIHLKPEIFERAKRLRTISRSSQHWVKTEWRNLQVPRGRAAPQRSVAV